MTILLKMVRSSHPLKELYCVTLWVYSAKKPYPNANKLNRRSRPYAIKNVF